MNIFYAAKLSFEDGPVEGKHTYALPFCDCPDCEHTKGAASGLQYSWVAADAIFDPRTLRRLLWDKSGSSTWPEYLLYFNKLREALPRDLPIAPGTNFGGWKGKVLSSCGELVLGGFDTLLLERRILNKLAEEGLSFETFEIELRPKKDYKPDLVEVFAPPVGLSCPSSGIRLCPTCNRGSTKMAVCVNAATVPPNAAVFRLRDAPNALVFSQKFVDACEKHGLRGLTFQAVLHELGPERTPEKLPATRTVVKPLKSSTPKRLLKPKIIKVPETFYADWINNLRRFSEKLKGISGSKLELQIESPATQSDISEIENALGKEIPASLKQFFLTGTKALNFSYSRGNELSGRIYLRLDDLAEHQKDAREWATETWISDDLEQKIIWRNAFPFAHLENGDFLGLDLRDLKADPKVVYLNHEAESTIISPSFGTFLQEWARLCYVGLEIGELEPFMDVFGHLSGEGKQAESLRQMCANAER